MKKVCLFYTHYSEVVVYQFVFSLVNSNVQKLACSCFSKVFLP